jgi:hypothetical protein
MRHGFSLLVILAAAVAAHAQLYPILPVANSPHGIVAMMQDSKSALWLGTDDDVYRFDGERFYSIRQYGFPPERVISMAEDSEGGIWIATDFIDGRDGVLRGGLYVYRNGRVERILSRAVESVVSAGDGTVFATVSRIASWEFGDLYIFRKSQGGWQGTSVSLDNAKWLSVDHQGSLLFPCRSGWCEFSRDQIARLPNENLQPQIQGSTGQVNSIRVLRDKSNCIWFRSAREEDYKCPGKPQVKLSDTDVGLDYAVQLSEASDGSILSAGKTLVLARPEAMRVVRTGNGLPGTVTAAVAASDGTIYIACGDDGTSLFRLVHPFRFEYWNQADGIDSPNSISRIGGKVFVSQAGIGVLDARGKSWTPWLNRNQVGTVESMTAGPRDAFYAASQVRGIAQVDRSGHVISRSDEHLDGAKLAEGAEGSIWFGGTGIRKVIRSGNRLRLVSQRLDNGRTEDIEYDRQRDLLWACYDHEVVVLAKDRWSHIRTRDGLVDDDCRSIALLTNGDVWVGYASNSRVSRIRRTESGAVHIDTFEGKNQGLRSGTAFLRADSRNRLWRFTEVASYVATPEAAATGDWIPVFEQGQGSLFAGAAPNSAFTDEDGSIWYAQAANVVHFSPTDDFASKFPKPDVFIAGITMDSKTPRLADAVNQIPYRARITAHIGSVQFDRRNAVHLRYRLLPGQSSWQNANSFDLLLGKLHWGTHRLQVQAQLATGPWSPIVEQTLTVEWPIWISWPLLLLYGTAGTGLGAGVSHWRKKRKLERELSLPDLSAWRMSALSPETESLIGTRVDGRYEIGHILSVGGFATVVRARDLNNKGQLCAVKIFRYEFGDRAWIRHRFEQEISALEQLSHPNIVRITGHGSIDTGAPYLVMEFIHGQTLREHLDKGALPPDQAGLFLHQIAGALGALHERAIYHRDLKPDNLMVRIGEHDQPEIVLIDFSIAIVKSRDQTFHGISRVAGTLEYMAPEQVIGFADASTDIYALAKILMEMLTGLRWSDLFPEAALDLPEQIRTYFATKTIMLCADSVDHIVSAMAFDPAVRPKDVLEFVRPIVRDLEQIP